MAKPTDNRTRDEGLGATQMSECQLLSHIGQRRGEVRKHNTQFLLLQLLVSSWEVESLEESCLNYLNYEIEKLEIAIIRRREGTFCHCSIG